jgi:hypothetical protein
MNRDAHEFMGVIAKRLDNARAHHNPITRYNKALRTRKIGANFVFRGIGKK